MCCWGGVVGRHQFASSFLVGGSGSPRHRHQDEECLYLKGIKFYLFEETENSFFNQIMIFKRTILMVIN